METKKQEAIRLAYGQHWEKYKNEVDDNGFCYFSKYDEAFLSDDIGEVEDTFDYESERAGERPISLKGIEDNNGWISINSEDDLPKDYEGKMFWIINNDHVPKKHFLAFFNGKFFTIEHFPMKTDTITHYKPILPPKPPIF